jgi:hypothetical protein
MELRHRSLAIAADAFVDVSSYGASVREVFPAGIGGKIGHAGFAAAVTRCSMIPRASAGDGKPPALVSTL